MDKFTVEIFAVGKWNGMQFTMDDLQKIASAYTSLKEVHKIPLKFGHNDKQQMTDGYPALGWVEDVRIEGDKLVAEFSSVPKIVRDAITSKLYRNVSIELDVDVEYKGTKYDYVLSAVALLGADLPAVKTLADLGAYLPDNGVRLTASRRQMFAAIFGREPQLETEMDEAKIKEMIAAAVAPLAEANKALMAENVALKQQTVEFSAKQKKDAADKARSDVNAILDTGVQDGSITPAQKATFSRTLGVDDDTRVVTIDLADVKAMVGTKKANFSQQSRQGGGTERIEEDAGEEIVRLADEEMRKTPGLKFTVAKELVMKRNPDLAREYIGGLEG